MASARNSPCTAETGTQSLILLIFSDMSHFRGPIVDGNSTPFDSHHARFASPFKPQNTIVFTFVKCARPEPRRSNLTFISTDLRYNSRSLRASRIQTSCDTGYMRWNLRHWPGRDLFASGASQKKKAKTPNYSDDNLAGRTPGPGTTNSHTLQS